MIFKQYILKDDDRLLSYVQDFNMDDVVLKDYFFFTEDSFINTKNLYTEKQIARILNITDKEYVTLINKFFTNGDGKPVEDSYLQTQKKIDEINQKIKKSKDYEDASKKINEIQAEIQKIDKDLALFSEIERKLDDANTEFKSYSQLNKFNLSKIHQDLVGINTQIEGLEEDLLNKKVIDIKKAKKKYILDQGKVGLAMGILVGMGIFGVIFWLIQAPFFITLFVWGLGILGALFLIAFSRYEVEVEEKDNIYSNYEYKDLNDLLDSLRGQRDAILKMLNMRNTNDFFLMKAKFSSIKKSLDYLNLERKRLTELVNYDELKQKRKTLADQMFNHEQVLQDSSVLLKSEDYLKYYRELDELKQRQSTNNNELINKVSKDDIPDRLRDIRKELLDKLPAYTDILKTTYQKNYDKISKKVSDLIGRYKITPFTISKDLIEWESLSLPQKMLVQYALASEIYQKNYVFLVEELKRFGTEGILLVQAITNDSAGDADSELIVIDYVNVF